MLRTRFKIQSKAEILSVAKQRYRLRGLGVDPIKYLQNVCIPSLTGIVFGNNSPSVDDVHEII